MRIAHGRPEFALHTQAILLAEAMHREISHSDQPFTSEQPLSLYLLTGVLGLLIGADLWPSFVSWMDWNGTWVPTWSREVYGYRLALIAAVLGSARALYGSLESLIEGKLGADLALAIAAIAAIFIGEPMVAAEVVFIGMVGEVLESVTFERTQREVRRLIEIRPRRCWLLHEGNEERIFVHDLEVGNHVVVKPGARIPADGVVLAGQSSLDVSALTGESIPQVVQPGDQVLTGSLNHEGALTIECQKVGEQTVVGQVMKLTADALKEKGAQERTADRLAKYFLPAVLALAGLTFVTVLLYNVGPFASGAPENRLTLDQGIRLATYPALSILVVACPCALILATPAAVIAALGRLAGTGVLIKSGSALEALAKTNAIAFDKTGTLTRGRLDLGEVIPFGDVSETDLLQIAATAEQQSEHVLAELILTEAKKRELTLEPLQSFTASPGNGVIAQTAAATIIVGTPRLLQEQNLTLSTEVENALSQLDASGQTALLVAKHGQIQGLIGARDRVRAEAVDVLTELRNLGITKISLLTGDRQASANVVAEQLEIHDVHAELLPHQKAELIQRWKSESGEEPGTIAMIGDGINDAPALAQADVGLAIGSGTEIAAEAGDVVLMGDPLRSLPLLIRLSRQTEKIIRQNILIFAFGVNFVGIVITAWLWPLFAPPGWYEQSPIAAVIYHQVGSFLVLVNAMRLLWFERKLDSPHVEEWKGRFTRVNAWLERNLNLDEWLHSLTHAWKKALLVTSALALIIYGLTGITVVAPDEVGVVQRFGEVKADLEPGVYWRWPRPVEKVTRVKPDTIQSVEIGFRPLDSEGQATTSADWSSSHGGVLLRRPDEAVMITGDENLIEVQAIVRYRIDREHLHAYLFEVGNPREVLHTLAEGVIREVMAGRELNRLLTAERETAQKDIHAKLTGRCQSTGANGIGIVIESVSLQELHPPPEVVPAYHKVAQAIENGIRLENVAKMEAMRNEKEAQSETERELSGALAEADAKLKLAQAERDVMVQLIRARREPGLGQEIQILGQWMTDPTTDLQSHRRQLVKRQLEVSVDRARWEVLAKTLAGQKKVIVDAKSPVPFYLFSVERIRELLPNLPTNPPR